MTSVTISELFFRSYRNTDNSGAGNSRIGETGPEIWRTLMMFDLTFIPAGSTISSAAIKLTTTTDLAAEADNADCYRVKQPNTSSADWETYDGSNAWSTPMCNDSNDRDTSTIASVATTATLPNGTQKTWTLNTSLFQAMIPGGGFINNGFLFRTTNEINDAYAWDIDGLDITYTEPEFSDATYFFFKNWKRKNGILHPSRQLAGI